MNVTKSGLQEQYGDEEGAKRFDEIAAIGGFGSTLGNYSGGLDIYSVIEPSNQALTEKEKDRIAELSGVNRKDADKMTKTGKSTTGRDIIRPTEGQDVGRA